MNVSRELVRSAQENEFFNPKSFQDLFQELFDIAQLYMLRSLQFKNAVDSVSVHGNKHAKCSLWILHNRTPVNVRVEKKKLNK